MKKLIICVLSLFLLSACNYEKTTETVQVRAGMIDDTVVINTVNGPESRNVVRVVDRNANGTRGNDVYYVEIEDMPCMIMYISSARSGITCDWDYWTGMRNADKEDEFNSSRQQSSSHRKLSRVELREQNQQ